MANETLHLRKGLLANLASAPYIEGALSFTTDEPAIYLDVDNKHVRIGDIKQFDTMAEFEAYVASYEAGKLPTSALYYIIGGEGESFTNALLKWTGTTWIQINEKSDFSGDISSLQTSLTTLSNLVGTKPESWTDATLWAAIEANRNAIAAEKERAEGIEGGLREDVDNLRADLGTKNDAKEVDTAFGRIAAEVARATAAESANANAVAAEKERAEAAEQALSERIDGKQATITGAATSIVSDKLVADRVLMSNADGDVAVSNVTATELSYVSGVTSGIQNQINSLSNTITQNSNSVAGEISGIKDTISRHNAAIEKNTGDISAIDQKVDNLDTAYKAADEQIQGSINGLLERVGAVEGKNTTQDEAISGLQEKDTALEKAIEDAEGRANSYADEAANQVRSEVNTSLSNLQADYQKKDAELAAKNTSQDEEIAAVAQSVTDLGTALRNEFADADEALKEEITGEYEAYVEEKLRVADAMVFKKVVSSADELPTSGVEAGWTYKVAENFELNGTKVYVGDLIIANSDQEGTDSYTDWVHISSGYEDDHDVHVALVDDKITIVNAAGAAKGSIVVAGDYTDANGGVKVTIASSSVNEITGVTDVSVNVEMVWGQF